MFELLRGQGAPVCHMLHFLQMSTEKLAKAYIWSKNEPPATVHTGLTNFMKFLGQVGGKNRVRIAEIFETRNFKSFEASLKSFSTIAYQLQNIFPRSQYDGPNPEYPWPHAAPVETPVDYVFGVWKELERAKRRELMSFIRIAIREFPKYADC